MSALPVAPLREIGDTCTRTQRRTQSMPNRVTRVRCTGPTFSAISAHEHAGVATPFSDRTTHIPGKPIDSTAFHVAPSNSTSRHCCAVLSSAHAEYCTVAESTACRHPSGPLIVCHTPAYMHIAMEPLSGRSNGSQSRASHSTPGRACRGGATATGMRCG